MRKFMHIIALWFKLHRVPEPAPCILVNARPVFYNQHTDKSIGNERRAPRGEGLF